MDRVVLVDEQDRPLGTMPKLMAHLQGRLHRAFSVLVLNDAGELLLQRRADGKYHSSGLWSNTCCSHPRSGEPVLDAGHRRLREEMGFDCSLRPAGWFIYRADVGGGLVEHELDHILLGRWNGEPMPDPAEVGAWRWVPLPELRARVRRNPEHFTAWFRLLLERLDDPALVAHLPPDTQVA
jgi:isopentenyl-diphosphate delta-isomerase